MIQTIEQERKERDAYYEDRRKALADREANGEDVANEVQDLYERQYQEELSSSKRKHIGDIIGFHFKTRYSFHSGLFGTSSEDALVRAYYTAKRLTMLREKDDVKPYEKEDADRSKLASPIIERIIAQNMYKPLIGISPSMQAPVLEEMEEQANRIEAEALVDKMFPSPDGGLSKMEKVSKEGIEIAGELALTYIKGRKQK